MASHTVTIAVLGPWSLRTSRQFWEGFTPSALPQSRLERDASLRTIFRVDCDWSAARADVTQRGQTALVDIFRQPFRLDGVSDPMPITASVGIAVGHRETPEDLLHEADMALYKAKAAGRNWFEVFRPEMGTDVQRRDELEFDVRSALESNQFQ